MGVDTKGIIRKNVTVIELSEYLKTKYSDVVVHTTREENFFTINFTNGNDKRTLWCHWGEVSMYDNHIQGVSLSFGLWGNAIEIMKDIVGHFGGYVDENDCDDDTFYAINIEKFTANAELSEQELFKHKIISSVGIDVMNKVLVLCEEYAELKLNQTVGKINGT